MKKTFTLLNLELVNAAVKDAENFGLTASVEEKDGQQVIAFESKALCEEKKDYASYQDVYSIVQSMASEFEYQLKWMREDQAYVREAFYKHVNNGHIPAIADAGTMKKVLKSLGLSDSFEVRTPSVYVEY